MPKQVFTVLLLWTLAIGNEALAQESRPLAPKKKTDVEYQLKYQFTKGQTRRYNVKGALVLIDEDMEVHAKHTVIEKTGAYQGKTKSQKIDLSSDKFESYLLKRGKKRAIKETFNEVMKAPMSFFIKNSGQVVQKSDSIDLKGAIFQPLASVFSSMTRVPYDYLSLPAKPIKVGGTWSQTRTLKVLEKKLEGLFETKFSYVLKRLKQEGPHRFATIQFSTSTKVLDDKTAPLSFQIKESKGKGTIIFNTTLGQIESIYYSQDCKLMLRKGEETLKHRFSAKLEKPQLKKD